MLARSFWGLMCSICSSTRHELILTVLTPKIARAGGRLYISVEANDFIIYIILYKNWLLVTNLFSLHVTPLKWNNRNDITFDDVNTKMITTWKDNCVKNVCQERHHSFSVWICFTPIFLSISNFTDSSWEKHDWECGWPNYGKERRLACRNPLSSINPTVPAVLKEAISSFAPEEAPLSVCSHVDHHRWENRKSCRKDQACVILK